MVQFDLPLEGLEAYQPDLREPADLSEFWSTTLAAAREYPLDVQWVRADTGLTCIDTWDVTFPGFDGLPGRGWPNQVILRQNRCGHARMAFAEGETRGNAELGAGAGRCRAGRTGLCM
jgi:cephalosporin-C deacetylase-like acetyl esterase